VPNARGHPSGAAAGAPRDIDWLGYGPGALGEGVLADFASWLARQPFPHKVVIPGAQTPIPPLHPNGGPPGHATPRPPPAGGAPAPTKFSAISDQVLWSFTYRLFFFNQSVFSDSSTHLSASAQNLASSRSGRCILVDGPPDSQCFFSVLTPALLQPRT